MLQMNIVVLMVSILFLPFPSIAGADQHTCGTKHDDGYYVLSSTKMRFVNQEECFKKEYTLIQSRRQFKSVENMPHEDKPVDMIGIGLSGGGIKSSAFQLGLLSGLHTQKLYRSHESSLLDRVDYISSVSGGSWANGAYWSAEEPDDLFFKCLDKVAALDSLGDLCKDFGNLLPNDQSDIWGSRKWQHQIINNFLRKRDKKIIDLANAQNGPLARRPFPIFLATHSNTIIGKKSVKNFPFEITPLSIGAIADCRSSETPCGFSRRYLRPLHWNNPPEQGFFIDLHASQDIHVLIQKYLARHRQTELFLSHAMWASGALVAKVFSLHLRLDRNGEKIEGVRRKYVLSDGGKTDNVGLIPLVERGVQLIILSQIAGDADIKFGDIKRASQQVKRLFDADVGVDELIAPHREQHATASMITRSCIQKGASPIGTLLLIKPTPDNIGGFYKYLKSEKKYKSLLDDLNENEMDQKKKMRFPQNDTIEFEYRKKLIYAYYVLGKYVAEQRLSEFLNNWLMNKSTC